MDAFVQTLHSALGRNEGVIARCDSAADQESPSRDDRTLARELASSLDRAIELGLWDHAQRIANQSMRIAREHPLLAERIARLRAARGDFDAALAIIDSCTSQPASMRLLRAVCLLQAGRGHEAHADLLHWAKKSSAPLQARLILALLEWESGHADDASAALQQTLRQIEDPTALAALMLMAVSQDRRHLAGIWANRLSQACAAHPHRRYFDAMLAANGFHRPRAQVAATAQTVSTLATELLAHEQLIPALAEAQRIQCDVATVKLLTDAIEHALDEVENRAAACEALATLNELLGETHVAEAWQSRADKARESREDVLASIGRDGVRTAAHSTPLAFVREEAA